MEGHVKVGGNWKTLEGIHVKVSGVWKEVSDGYIKVSGAWKQFYTSARVILSGTGGLPNTDADFSAGGTAIAGWRFYSTGDCGKYTGNAHNKPEWFGQSGDTTHQAPDATYYIRATNHADSNPDSGPTLGDWHSLASSRIWYWSAGPGFASSNGTLKIEISSDVSGSPIVATGYYRGEAESET